MQMLLEEPLLAWSEMLGLYWLASRSISYVTQIFLYFKKKKKKKWEELLIVFNFTYCTRVDASSVAPGASRSGACLIYSKVARSSKDAY